MMNYKDLPNENPFSTPVAGTYFAVISDAEVRESQTTFKPYLNITYNLFDKEGNDRGVMYDIITDGPKRIPLYKLRKLIDATEVKLEGDFDFEDLKEAIIGKAIIVHAKLRSNSEIPRLEPDVFKGDIYYPLSKSLDILGTEVPSEVFAFKDKSDLDESISLVECDEEDMPF